jgi:hypothetical protein
MKITIVGAGVRGPGRGERDPTDSPEDSPSVPTGSTGSRSLERCDLRTSALLAE